MQDHPDDDDLNDEFDAIRSIPLIRVLALRDHMVSERTRIVRRTDPGRACAIRLFRVIRVLAWRDDPASERTRIFRMNGSGLGPARSADSGDPGSSLPSNASIAR